MTTTTNVAQVKLNVMNQSQYDSATKNPTELYMVTDAQLSYTDLTDKPTIPTVTDTYSSTSSDGMSGKAVASALGSYVPTTRKVNNKALSSDITLSASDVGALPSSTVIPTITDTYSATSSNGMSGKAVASAISNKADKATSLS